MPTAPAIQNKVDMRHWTPRTTRSLVAYLNGRNNKGIDTVIAQITADQINASALEYRPPASTRSKEGVVLTGQCDGPHAEGGLEVLHEDQ